MDCPVAPFTAFLGGRKTVWLKNSAVLASEGDKGSKEALPTALRELADLIRRGLPDDIALLMNGRALIGVGRCLKPARHRARCVFSIAPIQSRTWRRNGRLH